MAAAARLREREAMEPALRSCACSSQPRWRDRDIIAGMKKPSKKSATTKSKPTAKSKKPATKAAKPKGTKKPAAKPKKPAAKLKKPAAKPKKPAAKLGALRLERPRSPFGASHSELREFERQQLQTILGDDVDLAELCALGLPTEHEMLEGDGDEIRAIEIVDAVDAKTGETLYQLVIVPFENGALFTNQTTDVVLSVVQNTIEAEEETSLGQDLVLAWREALGRLDLKSDHFYPE